MENQEDINEIKKFLVDMKTYITSGNSVPVERATIKANDLNRLINIAENSLELKTTIKYLENDLCHYTQIMNYYKKALVAKQNQELNN